MRTITLVSMIVAISVVPALAADYPRENIIDTAVGPDEAAVNVNLVSNRWPDCTTLESAVRSIWRIEGVADADDQAKAFALWKWFRVLVSGTGGGYAYEGAKLDRLVWDPHKILTVYGHHQCDGQSWAMVGLWRSAGLMAFDECHHGHTTAALRYQDADGVYRYHTFDPQGRFYYWDPKAPRVGTWRMPVMTGTVYRHITAPQHVHSLRTSLRFGERVRRDWRNTGHVFPNGQKKGGGFKNPRAAKYYEHRPGRTNGAYAINGEQVQTLQVPARRLQWKQQLYEGSANVARGNAGPKAWLLHPAEAGKPAAFVYRLAPPYVAVDATVTAELGKGRDDDLCRLSISRDSSPWLVIYDRKKAGKEEVTIDLGREAHKAGRPNVHGAYNVLLKAEFQTSGHPATVGMKSLVAKVYRQLNKRTLPNLMPGQNVFRVTFDKLREGHVIKLDLEYELKGKKLSQAHVIGESPYYFGIDAPGVALRKITNYDQDFGNEAVRMRGYALTLVPAGEHETMPHLEAAEGEAAFQKACPHPYEAVNRANQKFVKVPETDPIQTNGFFPQSRERREPDDRMKELIAVVRAAVQRNGGHSTGAWRAAQELGNYPAAGDFLVEMLPRAQIDMTLNVCKALAQIGEAKAVPALLAKWKRGSRGAPGTRYIPDALAAIAARTGRVDPSAVPALVKPLQSMRFDFRFHVAHALGELGARDRKAASLAEPALKDLAENDPFPAVRKEAEAALRKLRNRTQAKG